jgi:zinc transporter, ZIP family
MEIALSNWIFTLIPWVALVLGAGAALMRTWSPAVISSVQHLTAGVVFSAAATEVLPALQHAGSTPAVLVGGLLGLAAMFGIKEIGRRFSGAWSLIILVAVDILIDGIVLGIGFGAGEEQGKVLLIALTAEVLFLGLSATEELRSVVRSRSVVMLLVAAGGALLPLGALLGAPVHLLPSFYVTASFAFALIALLYLVTEELLVEAHHKPDTPLVASMFFVGFLGLLALEIPAG